MKIKNVLASVAAVGLAVAPVAASAGTRAASSLPVAKTATVKMGERKAAVVKKEEKLAGSGILIAILAGAAVIAGIIIAADDDRSDG